MSREPRAGRHSSRGGRAGHPFFRHADGRERWPRRPFGHPERLRHRTFWRVYLHGVVLLLVVGVALALTARLLGGTPGWRAQAERLAAYVASNLEPALDEPARLEVELRRLRDTFEVEPAVYRADGTPVLALGSDSPAAEESAPAELVIDHDHGEWRYAVPLRGDPAGAYLVVRAPPPHGISSLTLLLVVVLGAVALASVPLARAIARPLERLTAVVRRFGAGDRAVRSGMARNDEVGALAAAFDDMADRIDELLRRDRELLANVSHELKTPLARLRVALELCEPHPDEAGEPTAQGADAQLAALLDRLRGMSDDLGELERLVDDVMVMARLGASSGERAERVVLRRSRVALQGVLDEARVRFERNHPSREIHLDPGDEPALVDADATLLRRVFDNLLDNAAKYSDEASDPIEVGVEADEAELVAEVRDRGAGVAAEDLPRLFEPFFRADRSRARGTGGSGIGLAFCATVVRAHGGSMDAHLRDGGGLVVEVRLPRWSDAVSDEDADADPGADADAEADAAVVAPDDR